MPSETRHDMSTVPMAISSALYVRGFTLRQDQAALVGEEPAAWSRYLNAHRSPQCSKVQGWLDTAAAKGHALLLMWTPNGGCVAEVVDGVAEAAEAAA